jgi:hypothetical protein
MTHQLKRGICGGNSRRMRGREWKLAPAPGGTGRGGAGAVWEDSGSAPGEPAGADRGYGAGRTTAAGADAGGADGAAEGECGAAGLRTAAGRQEYRAEGAADGADDLGGGTVFPEDDYPSGDADAGSSAHAGGSRGDLQDRPQVSGLPAGGAARGPVADLAGECAADCFSGDRCAVQGRIGRRPECGPGIDGAVSALLGAGAVAGRSGGDAGGTASVDAARGGADSGVDAGRGGRLLPRGVAEGRRDGDGAALLPLVDGAALPGQGGG